VDIYDKWLITDAYNLVLNYNYVQAIIDDEKEGTDDYAGNKLPGVSDHSIKATLSYLPTKHTTLCLSQTYRSEAYAADDFANNFEQKQDAYNTTDISATYTKDNYEYFAKINNLFDQSNGLWVKDDAIYPVNFSRTVLAGLKLKF
jgi:iron complex outermembrane receptor protein